MKRIKKRYWLGAFAAMFLVAIAGLLRFFAAWHPQPPVSSPRDLAAPSPPSAARAVRLRLLTWNLWGLPFDPSRHRARMQALAESVAQTDADIVCFQEVFMEEDRRLLCEILAGVGLRHYRYFSSAPCGSGLLTLSRYPIVEAVFQRFSRGGNPLSYRHLDWWAGKGAGLVTIDLPDFGSVRVINTHLHARYRSEQYAAVRESQLRELFAFAETAASGGTPVFLLGDLNYQRDDPFLVEALKTRSWREMSRPWSHLDYVFSVANPRFGISSISSSPLQGELPDGSRLSDHRGIVADVQLNFTP